jgi:hypothetical protein
MPRKPRAVHFTAEPQPGGIVIGGQSPAVTAGSSSAPRAGKLGVTGHAPEVHTFERLKEELRHCRACYGAGLPPVFAEVLERVQRHLDGLGPPSKTEEALRYYEEQQRLGRLASADLKKEAIQKSGCDKSNFYKRLKNSR